MRLRRFLPLFLLVVSIALFAGCGEDATQPNTPAGSGGIVQGEIGKADFEFIIQDAGPPADPYEGPFALRGSNLHYDAELGALVVDLTLVNRGMYAHHEPAVLTFVDLIPDDVTVQNPDNDVHGAGAAIVFHFANDDGVWTPGESSLPRTVQFGVAEGHAIGFIARLDLGEAIDGGSIRGLVWHDANENGVRDDGEPGVPGFGVQMYSFYDGDSTRVSPVWTTITGPDGRYEFDQLRPGGYVITSMLSTIWYRPTTPTEIRVLLVDANGDVSDFDGADFGVIPQDIPPPIEIGTRVDIEGKFLPPDVFEAFTLFFVPCGQDTVPPGGGGGDDGARFDGDDPNPECFGARVRGPVTEVAPLRHAFRVMNTWIVADPSVLPAEIKVGMRLDVHVHRGLNMDAWVADHIARWDGSLEQLLGRVEAVDVGPDGRLRIRVLDTWVGVPEVTVEPR